MQTRLILFSKIKKEGNSNYILLPKSEYKYVNSNKIYKFEIVISEVD